MGEFFRFEFRYRLRQPAIYIFCAIFFLLAFGATTTDAVIIGGSVGQVARNAPFVITNFMLFLSVFAVFLIPAFVATAVTRDFELGTASLFFTRPIRKFDYLWGRFAASVLLSFAMLVAAAFGVALGAEMPWLEPERVTSPGVVPYLTALGVMALPNLLLMSALVFALAVATRRVLGAYVGIVAFLVGFSIAGNLVGDLDSETIAALVDPFGASALQLTTRYWTPVERNTMFIPLSGILAVNRILWLSVAGLLAAWSYRRFRLRLPEEGAGKKTAVEPERSDRDRAIPTPRALSGFRSRLVQLSQQVKVEFRGIARSAPFLVLVLLGAVQVVGSSFGFIDQLFGTPVYPVTRLMLSVVQSGFALFLLVIITLYAGDLVWRERRNKLHEVYDAMPIPNWVPLLAKLGALMLTPVVLLTIGGLTTVVIQLLRGYTDLEPGLYLKGLFLVELPQYLLLCVLAVFVQVLAKHRYLGYLIMVLYFVAGIALPAMDFEHNLYLYGEPNSIPYSDMNGYGHYAHSLLWMRLYWGFFAVVLVLIANLFWVRGTDTRMRLRAKAARRRVTRLNTAALVGACAGTLAAGIYIYYNTNVLNRYEPGDKGQRIQVEYETRYKQYEGLPHPRLVAVRLEADLFPYERRLETRGEQDLVNKTEGPISSLHVLLDREAKVRELEVPGGTLTTDDTELGYRIYTLDPPLPPGEKLTVRFGLGFENPGFKNGGSNTNIVYNGSFFNSGRYVPHFGYSRAFELGDRNERRKEGLPERPRMADLEDVAARANTYISHEADWIDYSATVSTAADQLAISPGYLTKEWTEGDRRYFHYEMDSPILNFFSVLSARYTVRRDQWKDVAIEIYYHEPHHYNVDRMVESIKKSLDYFTVNFSPYQHRQVRIIEFPRYQRFAQSFPNTIPYSEGIGFIADLTDEDDIDYVFYVTAHEVAHQWWAHQVIGADVQGSTLMSETLAQYSALMVMEKEYGKDKMKKFLRYELDRYLAGRGTEQRKELPLYRVENQPYIHYRKGSLVMYALRDYIGEDRVNKALASYIERVGYQGPPYTTSVEFLEEIRKVTPPEFEYLIEDMFETITLYDNRTKTATYAKTEEGRYRVTLDVLSRKIRADESGGEQEVALDDLIEVGVYGEDAAGEETVLFLEKRRFTGADSTIEVVVDDLPVRAGIDPNVLLIDRDPDDNIRAVKAAG